LFCSWILSTSARFSGLTSCGDIAMSFSVRRSASAWAASRRSDVGAVGAVVLVSVVIVVSSQIGN